MPARDDALPLYVKEQGATLGKSGDELTVKSRQTTLQKVKLIDTSQVSLFGNVQVTAQAVRELASAGIPLCHFSYGGWFNAVTVGMIHKNVELRIAQFAAAADPGRSLALARQFVLGKIKNCRTLLRRHLEEDQGREVLGQLNTLMRKAEAAADAASLLGIEGMAAKEYFAGFAKLLNGGEPFNIEGRNRRPPRDPVNALLSFVYALLVKEWTLALYAAGFDPLLGVLPSSALWPAVAGLGFDRGIPAAGGRFDRPDADQQRRGDAGQFHSPGWGGGADGRRPPGGDCRLSSGGWRPR